MRIISVWSVFKEARQSRTKDKHRHVRSKNTYKYLALTEGCSNHIQSGSSYEHSQQVLDEVCSGHIDPESPYDLPVKLRYPSVSITKCCLASGKNGYCFELGLNLHQYAFVYRSRVVSSPSLGVGGSKITPAQT